jgi:protein TonB
MNAVPLSQFMPYGAPELLGAARRHLLRALVASSSLCILAFALSGALLRLVPPPPPDPIVAYDPADLRPPPLIERVEPPPPVEPARAGRPDAGIAIPVPPEEVKPDATIADQEALRRDSPGLAGERGRGPIEVAEPPEIPPTPDAYTYVEELPAPVRMVHPEYPALARQAGVSGVVWVRVLLDREGRVRDAILDPKGGVPMLNEAALAAARQWVFEPALSNGKPVMVWVSIPFRFRLN